MLAQNDIIYFVVTDRFCKGRRNERTLDPTNPKGFHGGDFAGLKKKIPYLQRLGVTAIWITPVYLDIGQFFDSSGYHGYWAMDFERVDPRLSGVSAGTAKQSRAQLKNLVADFHQAGLKLILDMVVNHTGYHTQEYLDYPQRRFEARHFNPNRPGDPVDEWLSGLPDLDRRITTEILDRVGHWDRNLAREILQLCFTLLFTTRGIPQIYYGSEIGLEGGRDPDNRRDMPWGLFGSDQRPKSKHPFEQEVFDHLCRLIRLRKAHPAICYGYLFTLYVDSFIYAYLREFRGDLVLVALNNGREAMPAPLRI